MWIRLPSCVLVAVFLGSGSACAATDVEERSQILSVAQEHFLRDEFGALEQDSIAYRTGKGRTSSGLWKLTSFYDGIDSAVNSASRSPDQAAAFADMEQKTARWAHDYPASTSARVAHALVSIDQAWAIRGDRYAPEVDPAAWPGFAAHLALARKDLEESKSIAAADPGWYVSMLRVAIGQNWNREQFDALLEEALAREPLYYTTYFTALHYLLPKWHGDVKEIEAFARAAVARTSKYEGRGMYARVYWVAYEAQFRNSLFRDSLVAWPLMNEGFEHVLAKYPDSWNLNAYAMFACLAQDRKKTGELLLRIGPAVIPQAWSPRSLHKECSQWSLTGT